ncbi:MAG TPA: glycosyltransferase family 4 protein [Pyrinomonadaceae bacterium]|nr:glycosyltransferase family 4 protein [Pyrinomonadaceae bacterium]
MTADTVGGVWTYALELTRALEPHGVEVQLALMGPPLTTAQREEADEIANLSLFKSDYKLEWMPECWPDVRRAGEWLLHLANRLNPDLIHLNGYAHANLPWTSPVLVVGHSCVFSWWQAVRGDTPPAEWQRYKSEVTNALRGAHFVVAPTVAMLRALETHYGKIYNGRVIANGRDKECFKPAEKQRFILSAGRLWDRAKNIERVAELAPELPWPVFVAGECRTPERPEQTRAFNDKCNSVGQLSESELRNWFGAASIYALPALYEPFGFTPLEAGLSACALVLGDIESLREIWDGAAVFVDPTDGGALKSALLQLISNDNYRHEMAHRARVRALQFSTRRMAEDYLAAYADLLTLSESFRKQESLAQCA